MLSASRLTFENSWTLPINCLRDQRYIRSCDEAHRQPKTSRSQTRKASSYLGFVWTPSAILKGTAARSSHISGGYKLRSPGCLVTFPNSFVVRGPGDCRCEVWDCETHTYVGLLGHISCILTLSTDRTVKDYFDANRSTLFPDGDELIVRTCLTYLSFDDFAKNISLDQTRAGCQYVRQLLADEEYPFLQYATTCWGRHVAKMGGSMSPGLHLEIGNFLLRDGTLFLCAVALWSSVFDFHRLAQLSLNGNKHHYHYLAFISWFGLMPLLPLYIADGAPRDGGLEDDCLLLGAKNGQDDIVQFFIDRGADCDGASDSDGSALWNATIRGYTSVVATLLRHGAGNNAKIRHADSRSLSPNRYLVDLMQEAHRRGRSEVERLLKGRIYGMSGERLGSSPGGLYYGLMPGLMSYPLPSLAPSPDPVIPSPQGADPSFRVPTPATKQTLGHTRPNTLPNRGNSPQSENLPGSSGSYLSRPQTFSNLRGGPESPSSEPPRYQSQSLHFGATQSSTNPPGYQTQSLHFGAINVPPPPPQRVGRIKAFSEIATHQPQPLLGAITALPTPTLTHGVVRMKALSEIPRQQRPQTDVPSSSTDPPM